MGPDCVVTENLPPGKGVRADIVGGARVLSSEASLLLLWGGGSC